MHPDNSKFASLFCKFTYKWLILKIDTHAEVHNPIHSQTVCYAICAAALLICFSANVF